MSNTIQPNDFAKTINELFENKVAEKFDNITIERSKQRIIVDLNFESLIKKNIFKLM